MRRFALLVSLCLLLEVVSLNADTTTKSIKSGNIVVINGFKYEIVGFDGDKAILEPKSIETNIQPMEWVEVHYPDEDLTVVEVEWEVKKLP